MTDRHLPETLSVDKFLDDLESLAATDARWWVVKATNPKSGRSSYHGPFEGEPSAREAIEVLKHRHELLSAQFARMLPPDGTVRASERSASGFGETVLTAHALYPLRDV